MTTEFTEKHLRGLIPVVFASLVLITCAGCQTFSLSEEDFQKQQRGEMVDRETGETVAVVGTLGYYLAMIGEAIATALGR